MLMRVTVAEETPCVELRVEAPAEHCPVALNETSCILGRLLDMAVAVTVMTEGWVLPIGTELGNGPRTMVCPNVSTAGADGALCRGVELGVSETSVVETV